MSPLNWLIILLFYYVLFVYLRPLHSELFEFLVRKVSFHDLALFALPRLVAIILLIRVDAAAAVAGAVVVLEEELLLLATLSERD